MAEAIHENKVFELNFEDALAVYMPLDARPGHMTCYAGGKQKNCIKI